VRGLSFYQWDDEPVVNRGGGTKRYSGWQTGLRFNDGAAYETMMGRWSVLVAAPFLGRLDVGIARSAPPDIGAWIGGFRPDLRQGLAGALAHHRRLGAGRLLEGGDADAALFLENGAIDGDRRLSLRREGHGANRGREGKAHP